MLHGENFVWLSSLKQVQVFVLWVKGLSSDVYVSYPWTCYGTTRQHNIIAKIKKVVSNSSGLVDFAIALVDFILNLPTVQDSDVFWGIKITV